MAGPCPQSSRGSRSISVDTVQPRFTNEFRPRQYIEWSIFTVREHPLGPLLLILASWISYYKSCVTSSRVAALKLSTFYHPPPSKNNIHHHLLTTLTFFHHKLKHRPIMSISLVSTLHHLVFNAFPASSISWKLTKVKELHKIVTSTSNHHILSSNYPWKFENAFMDGSKAIHTLNSPSLSINT